MATAEDFEIEAQGEHEYLVHLHGRAEDSEAWVRVTPEVLARLGVAEVDEEAVVRRTIASMPKSSSMRRRAAVAMRTRSSGSRSTRSIPRAAAAGSLGGTRMPVCSGITSSPVPPTSVATATAPADIASITTLGSPS